MTIGGVNCGPRQPPAYDDPGRATSVGVSAAGDVKQHDYGRNIQYVVLTFNRMAYATKNSLKTALETTAKPGGVVSVTPDSNDDLGVGASGATNFYYVEKGFHAEHATNGNTSYWKVTVTLLYIS